MLDNRGKVATFCSFFFLLTLIFLVCETYVNVLRTGRIALSILGYKKEDMCWGSDNIKDRKWRKWEDVEWAPSGNTKKFFARNSEDRVFKEYYAMVLNSKNLIMDMMQI